MNIFTVSFNKALLKPKFSPRIQRRFCSTDNQQLDISTIGAKKYNVDNWDPKYKEMRRTRDHILRTFTPTVRIAIINNTKTAQVAKDKHNLSHVTTKILGRTMAASAILASDLEGEERVEVRINAAGPLDHVVVEAIRTGEVRGFVSDPSFYMTPSAPIGFALRGGTFSVSKIRYGSKAPYRSIVPLASGDITSEMMNYYKLSDQIPAHADFETIVNHEGQVLFSGGLIIEALPPLPGDASNVEYITPYVERLQKLPPLSVLFVEEARSLNEVLDLIAPEEISEENMRKILSDFYCRCSKEKFMNQLVTLSQRELHDYIDNITDEQRNLQCHFCNKVHRLDDHDLLTLKSK